MLTFLQKFEGPGNMFLIYLIYCMLIVNILPISGNLGAEWVQYLTEKINGSGVSSALNKDRYISLYPLALYIINNIGWKHLYLFGMMGLIVVSCLRETESPLQNFSIQILCIVIVPLVVFAYRYNYPLDNDNEGEYKGESIMPNIYLFLGTTVGLILSLMSIMFFRMREKVFPGTLNTNVISILIMGCFLALYFRPKGVEKIFNKNIDRWKEGFPGFSDTNTDTDWVFTLVFLWVLIGLIATPIMGSETMDSMSVKLLLPSSTFNKGQSLTTSLIIILITSIVMPLKKDYFKLIFVIIVYIHSYCAHSDTISGKIEGFHKKMSNRVRDFEASHHPSVRNALNKATATATATAQQQHQHQQQHQQQHNSN